MDMVNDGKDPLLDTPQAVKEALLSGKDLYNPQTGVRRASQALSADGSVDEREPFFTPDLS